MTVTTKDVKEVFPDAMERKPVPPAMPDYEAMERKKQAQSGVLYGTGSPAATGRGVAEDPSEAAIAKALEMAKMPLGEPLTLPRTIELTGRNIFQRMHAVMQDVRGVAKDSYNPHGKYKYQGHLAVTAALREAYVKHGVVRCADITKVEREGGLLRLYVRVTWINIDNPSDKHTVETLGESAKMTTSGEASPVQAGVALSYAVKIAELKAFSLTDDDTPDADEESESNGAPQRQQQPTPKPRQEPKEPLPASSVAGMIAAYENLATKEQLDVHRANVGRILDSVTAEDYKRLENADAAAVARLSKKG